MKTDGGPRGEPARRCPPQGGRSGRALHRMGLIGGGDGARALPIRAVRPPSCTGARGAGAPPHRWRPSRDERKGARPPCPGSDPPGGAPARHRNRGRGTAIRARPMTSGWASPGAPSPPVIIPIMIIEGGGVHGPHGGPAGVHPLRRQPLPGTETPWQGVRTLGGVRRRSGQGRGSGCRGMMRGWVCCVDRAGGGMDRCCRETFGKRD